VEDADPFIALVPDPSLSGFDRLPVEEQRLRARIYATVLVLSGSVPYAWSVALNRDPAEVTLMREFISATPDEWIWAGVRRAGIAPLKGSL